MAEEPTAPFGATLAHESYIVREGKKRGAERDVRDEARHDRFYTVLRVHGGDAVLTENWHTDQVLGHVREKFAGFTFAMRTLEAWGAEVESDRRAWYVAGGRVWAFDLEPAPGPKERLPGAVPGRT